MDNVEQLKVIMDLSMQQALLRGQMEGFASIMELLAPELGMMPPSSGVLVPVSIAATEALQPLLRDIFISIGGLSEDIKVAKVHELGAVIAMKGLQLAQVHSAVSEEIASRVAKLEAENA